MTLRLYQSTALSEVDAAFAAGERSVLLVMPTGAGKTVCFAHAAERHPGRVLIVAHRRELIRQAISKVHGSSEYPNAHPTRIQVGSIQTVSRRLDRLPRFDRIVIDEAHHAVAGAYTKLLEAQPWAEVLGVTATPERLDGRGLRDRFGHMVQGPSVAELVGQGFLCRVETYGPAAPPDVRALHTMAGDWKARDLETVMDKPSVTGDAIDEYGWRAPAQPAIAFCVSVAMAEKTAAAFRTAGWRAVAVSGDTPEHQRDAALAGLATGAVEVVCSCALIDEGLDVPGVSCVIDLAPTKSLSRFLQRVGRGMRPAPGKPCMVHLDHAGNTLRHGMPDMPRIWSLDGRPRRDSGAPPTRQCPECFAIHAPRSTCPACGFDYDAARLAAERREMERIAGELALLSPDDRRLRHLRTTPLKDLLKDAVSFDDLQEISDARGFKPGWAYRQAAFRQQQKRGPDTGGDEFMQDRSCTCHLGHPPCGFCCDMPAGPESEDAA